MKNPALLTLWIVGAACVAVGLILIVSGQSDGGLFAEADWTRIWIGAAFAGMGGIWVAGALVIMGVREGVVSIGPDTPQPRP